MIAEMLHPSILLQLVVGGLLSGALYALLACGLNLVLGVMRVINLAHAELMLVGAFLTYLLWEHAGIHPLLSLPLVLVVLFFVGYYLQSFLIEHIVGKGELASLMVTYGVAIILMNVGLLIFSSDFKSVPALQGALFLGDLVVSKPRGVAGIIAVIITLGVYLFLKKSRMGKAIRAVSEHPDVALICGIDVVKIRMLTFGLAAAMAAAAGVMLTMIYSFSPETGADFILKCFAIIIIGGMGNFVGAFFGALILGLAESFVGGFISTQWAEAVSYALLVLILLIKPTGLRGRADVQ